MKSARLRSSQEYRLVYQAGNRLNGKLLQCDFRAGHHLLPRLGITVSRHYGNAIARNRLKRLLREAFRICHKELPPRCEINLSPRRGCQAEDLHDVLADLQKFLPTIVSCRVFSSQCCAKKGS